MVEQKNWMIRVANETQDADSEHVYKLVEDSVKTMVIAWSVIFKMTSLGTSKDADRLISGNDLSEPSSDEVKDLLRIYSLETFLPAALARASLRDKTKLVTLGPFA